MIAPRRLLWTAITLACLSAMAGCASERVSPRTMPGATLDQARGPDENARLYTDLIRQMMAQDRFYAALAHLEAREREFGVSDELRLLRADILRRMDDKDAATVLYRQLLDSPFAGQAHHGLGLVLSPSDPARGLEHLEKAVAQVPTDARMRNDLGYALLRQGDYRGARLQLATAYQLDEDNELNRNNYILLLLVEGDAQRAAGIAARSHVGANLMRELRNEARMIAGRGADDVIQSPEPPPPPTPESASSARPAVGGGGG